MVRYIFPELNRQAFLEKDMVFYYGDNWKQKITSSTASQTYIARIREIAAHQPTLLLGHTYTRYMGDLSGGQMLQKIAQSALQLSGYEGTSFYHFEQIPDKNAFKDNYRQVLNSLEIDDAMAEKIVIEANQAFQLNLQMAQELEEILIKSLGQSLFDSLTHSDNSGN